MAVDGVTSATNTTTTTTNNSSASSASAADSLDYDSFLKLLIAQMQNQDPTDPMDASEQIAQLATFSQVEQTIQTNANLETLITGNALTNASNYIGQTITSADEKLWAWRVWCASTTTPVADRKATRSIVAGVRVGAIDPDTDTDTVLMRMECYGAQG
jgi:flagellar basal-body rod modification protein FlgD